MTTHNSYQVNDEIAQKRQAFLIKVYADAIPIRNLITNDNTDLVTT